MPENHLATVQYKIFEGENFDETVPLKIGKKYFGECPKLPEHLKL